MAQPHARGPRASSAQHVCDGPNKSVHGRSEFIPDYADTRLMTSLQSKSSRRRQRFLALVVFLGVLGTVTGAIAYWTVSASSEGEYAKTKSTIAGLAISNIEGSELYPGGAATPKAKVENTESSASDHVKTLSVAVEAVTNSGTLVEAEAGTKCYKGWFEVKKVNGTAGTSVEINATITHGASAEYPVEVEMKEESTKNQNGCKSQHVTLKYSVS
jgi:hypothetical protein